MPDSFATTPDGLLLASNGVDRPVRWDGLGEFMGAGVEPPTQALTLAAWVPLDGGGNPIPSTVAITGAYTAYVRFVDSEGNPSDLSPVSAEVTLAAAPGIRYTSVALPAESRVKRRQILRNTAGQAATYYVDVDTQDLTSTSFTSTRTDSEMATQEAVALFDENGIPLANTHGVPPDTKAVVAAHLDRMFLAAEVQYAEGAVSVTLGSATVTGAGTEWPATFGSRFLYVAGADRAYEIDSVDPATQTLTLLEPYGGATDAYARYAIRPPPGLRRTVAYSQAGQPESWPAGNALSVQEDGDDLTGLMARGSFLYFLERRHIYRFTFQQDPAQDGYVFLACSRGCVNHRSWVSLDQAAYLLDEQGVHAFKGGSEPEPQSDAIQDLFEPSGAPGPWRINWAARRYFHAVHEPGSEIVRFFVCLSGHYLPRHALCLDTRRQGWWLEEYPFPVGSSAQGRLDGRARVFLGGPAGRVFVLGVGTLDLVDPSLGTVRGTASGSTPLSLSDTTAAFSTALVGAPVVIYAGRGQGQVRTVTSLTATTLRLDRPWRVRPDTTSGYQIGGIGWRYRTGVFRWAPAEYEGKRRLEVVFTPTKQPGQLGATIYLDRGQPYVWDADYPADEAGGFASERGSSEFTADTTRVSGTILRRLDGHKDRYLDGPSFIEVGLAGVTNQDPVVIHGLTIEGAQ